MNKLILLLPILFSINLSFANYSIKSSLTVCNALNRSAEIRYVTNHPSDQNFIIVEEKKYFVFDSREAAINYAENMSVKYDLVIVYVRSEVAKSIETIELSK